MRSGDFALSGRGPFLAPSALVQLAAPAQNQNAPATDSTQQFPQCRAIRPLVLSTLRTLFLAPERQPSPFHAFRNSLTHRKNITIAFPVTSALFVRSFAQERKSTPFLSCACALFCRYVGVARARNMLRSVPLSGRIARNPAAGVGCTCSPRKK